MKKYVLLVCAFISISHISLAAHKRKSEKIERSSPSTTKSESIDDLFNVHDSAPLAKPVFNEPSSFTAWIRSRGIAFLYWSMYRYNGVKAWCMERYRSMFKRRHSHAPRL